jgi:hypothetical protein
MGMERHGGVMLRGGKRRTLRKTFPSTALLTTNPIWTDPVANPDLCGERPELISFSNLTTVPYSSLASLHDPMCYKCVRCYLSHARTTDTDTDVHSLHGKKRIVSLNLSSQQRALFTQWAVYSHIWDSVKLLVLFDRYEPKLYSLANIYVETWCKM